MPFLTLLLTAPLLFIAYESNYSKEKFYWVKLLLIWFICQLYITLNNKYKLPIGIIAASIIVYNDSLNQSSKLKALLIGCISFLCSNLVSLIYKL